MAANTGEIPSADELETPSMTAVRQSDRAFESIKNAIVRCDLRPGLLVSEVELGQRFSLNRAATRAALERLSAQGLVRPQHRRGYEVRPIRLRDLNDLYQMREIIELATVRLAAGRVDEAGLRRLDRICSKSYEPTDRDSVERFLRANTEFHLQVASATKNVRLTSALADVLHEMERFFHFGLAVRNRTGEMQHEHGTLIEALAHGNLAAAEQAIQEELATSKRMVLEALMSSTSLMDVSIS